MIVLSNGWAQWDYQIGTFRAMVGDVIYGKYTDDLPNAIDLARFVPLTSEQIDDLQAEKSDFEINREGNGPWEL